MQSAMFNYSTFNELFVGHGHVGVIAIPVNAEAHKLVAEAFKKGEFNYIDKDESPRIDVSFEIFQPFSPSKESTMVLLNASDQSGCECVQFTLEKHFMEVIRVILNDIEEREDVVAAIIRKCTDPYYG